MMDWAFWIDRLGRLAFLVFVWFVAKNFADFVISELRK